MSKDIYLVIGGSGFLGRHVVTQLKERGDNVSVFDIMQRYHDTPFFAGDISQQDQVADAIRVSGTTCIIHTAAPPPTTSGNEALHWKVSVEGTKAVIAAAVACGVRKLVYTSSSSVIYNGQNVIHGDERLPYPEKPLDAYNETKAAAEQLVVGANGKGGLLTVVLRPAGIFGAGDRQFMPNVFSIFERGQSHIQVGDNTALVDWTCVENVAYAHLLAADKLVEPPPPEPVDEDYTIPNFSEFPDLLTEEELATVSKTLPPINFTSSAHRVPTSEARPLGPYVTPPKNAAEIEKAWNAPVNWDENERPIARTKFDQLSHFSIARAKVAKNIAAAEAAKEISSDSDTSAIEASTSPTSTLTVAGQIFCIANGEPIYFWDLLRVVWNHLDQMFPEKRSQEVRTLQKRMNLSSGLAWYLGLGSECWSWLIGKEPTFTRYKVAYTTVNRYYNIEKARRVLGYQPQIGIEEGAKRMVEWWREEYLKGTHTTPQQG